MNGIGGVLSASLAERTWAWRDIEPNGKFVLYWMKHAVRGHENPALDVALSVAFRASLPLLVYHEVAEDEPYASDRRLAFEIEGAKDVQLELSKRSIDYFFWIQKKHSPRLLYQLAKEAALVVCEDMPVTSERIAKQALVEATGASLWQVDAACIVPMQVAGQPYNRAFAYRQATARERTRRLEAPYVEIEHQAQSLSKKSFDVEQISLQNLDLYKQLSLMDIDHSLSPIKGTEGGSVAGYRRWHSFLNERMFRYARDRNDPLLNPSSRMSAYLRLGHVSPFRIAREAALSKVQGVDKFLDELLVWRELAYTFCRFTPELEKLAAIPVWAVDSLRAHENDARPKIYTYNELFFAKTDDRLWNAAQLSLLHCGELHNNVRMTWGKQFLQWCTNAEDALAKMIDLNHRLALDGNDPSSYGGLLWCLGQFDRPFPPERPICGLVRTRSTASHASRLNVDLYLASIEKLSDYQK